MSEPSRFEPIGNLVQEEVDPSVSVDSHRSNRVRFVEAAQRRSGLGRRSSWFALAGALAAAAVLVLVLVAWPQAGDRALVHFTVGVEKRQGQVGRYIAPVALSTLPVQFSDGSTLRVHPASRVRVAETTSRGASVALEAGRVDLHVKHRENSAWTVVAGPYRVRVTGTRFAVTWRPEEGHAEVRVDEGVVVVTGPTAEGGVEVRAGQTFSSRNSARVEPSPAHSGGVGHTSPMKPADLPAPHEESDPAHPMPAQASSKGQAGMDAEPEEGSGKGSPLDDSALKDAAPPASPPTWGELAAKGQYEQIVKQAEARGTERVLSSGSADDLQVLSQAARFTGRGGLGHRCLMQLRARYPRSGQARAAAFVLGRMADQGGQSSAALQWYEIYLNESPGGALAAEAQGRRMVLLRHMGRASEAKSAARRYLKFYPSGAYAPVAKDMLGL